MAFYLGSCLGIVIDIVPDDFSLRSLKICFLLSLCLSLSSEERKFYALSHIVDNTVSVSRDSSYLILSAEQDFSFELKRLLRIKIRVRRERALFLKYYLRSFKEETFTNC